LEWFEELVKEQGIFTGEKEKFFIIYETLDINNIDHYS
jgi:hypothetical protein